MFFLLLVALAESIKKTNFTKENQLVEPLEFVGQQIFTRNLMVPLRDELLPDDLYCEYFFEGALIKWKYINCEIVKVSLYFSDNSAFLNELLSSDIPLALTYMTKLLDNKEYDCNTIQEYEILLKGDLIFILEGTINENTTIYSIDQISIGARYKCEIDSIGMTLVIAQKPEEIMVIGNRNNYIVYNHGDLANDYDAIGELGSVLCGYYIENMQWYSKCKSPAMLIGKKITINDDQGSSSCILQKHFQDVAYSREGICRFYKDNKEGFIIIKEKMNYLEVIGFADWDEHYSINVMNSSYDLSKDIIDKKIKIQGKLPLFAFLGQKISVNVSSDISHCVIGQYNPKE